MGRGREATTACVSNTNTNTYKYMLKPLHRVLCTNTRKSTNLKHWQPFLQFLNNSSKCVWLAIRNYSYCSMKWFINQNLFKRAPKVLIKSSPCKSFIFLLSRKEPICLQDLTFYNRCSYFFTCGWRHKDLVCQSICCTSLNSFPANIPTFKFIFSM